MKFWDWLVDMCIWHETTLPFEEDEPQYTIVLDQQLGKNDEIVSIEILGQ